MFNLFSKGSPLFFAKLHPLLVHFPVALLVTGVLFEIYGEFQKEEAVSTAGHFNTRLGFAAILPVIAVGVLGVLGMEVREKFRSFLGYHILAGGLTATLFLGALIISRFRNRWWGRVAYFLLLILGLVGVLTTGYFGGELVHRFGVSTLHPLE